MVTLTVSQLNRYVKSVIEGDKKLADVYLKGEISNFTNHYRSGHYYFSLKDEKSAVKAVMFESHASFLPFLPENGMTVLVRAGAGVYERDGVYQLYVTDMQPHGLGAMAAAYEQRRQKLADEGLFDSSRKKSLPAFPEKIGVVTSETGAAFRDIVQVLSRRWPIASVTLYPAPVQGEGAADALAHGVRALDGKCDVIILARGGGSAEDLWQFNDENLVRAVAAASTPLISAVGHETDTTLCDFAADVRAPTPSAAAELAVPSAAEVYGRVRSCGYFLRQNALGMLGGAQEALDTVSSGFMSYSPRFLLEKKRERLDFLADMLYNSKNTVVGRYSSKLARRAGVLFSPRPLRGLARGYSAVH
ncbi:MAG: exodeoxyribonuclease VII large subunit [Oscillospiraceae bacterium]|nr:exodeoxyribonuclease VII large subunit [Oscillospiraceae bacterium]